MKNFLLPFFLFMTGCVCFQPAHRNDPQCAVLNQVVDCTEQAVIQNIAQFKPLVQQLIAEAKGENGAIDWTKVEKGLGGIGIKDGGCILADLEKDYMTPATGLTAEPPEIVTMKKSYHENYNTYRQKKWPGIKFKVVKPDGSVVEL